MAEATTESVRTEVRAWIDEQWDPDRTVAEWWQRLSDGRWAVPTWPETAFGRGYGGDLARVVSEELREVGAVGAPAGLGILLAGPTIYTHGDAAQQERYLGPIVNGQEAWCQLFSEPGAGSDLASLQTKAERDGDEWVITGQKVWTSGGQAADLGMLIARTDPEAPKHQGITYFAFEMDQPGVEVRPLREMTGRALFSEVFIDGARVSNDAMIGGLNNGWAVANATLAFERAGLGGGGLGAGGGAFPGRKGSMLDTRVGDLVGGVGRGRSVQPSAFGGSYGMFQSLAEKLGRTDDAVIRQHLVELYTLNEIGRMTMLRMKAERAAGRGNVHAGNLAKLLMSKITRLSRDLGPEILGPEAMLTGPETTGGGFVQEMTLFAPAPSIYGGTDEVQRNIIGERALGLPKEPGPDKLTPFRELRVGTQPV